MISVIAGGESCECFESVFFSPIPIASGASGVVSDKRHGQSLIIAPSRPKGRAGCCLELRQWHREGGRISAETILGDQIQMVGSQGSKVHAVKLRNNTEMLSTGIEHEIRVIKSKGIQGKHRGHLCLATALHMHVLVSWEALMGRYKGGCSQGLSVTVVDWSHGKTPQELLKLLHSQLGVT